MLTTSPWRSARHSSSRSVRTSRRAVSPSFEICPDAGSTRQSPMRSGFVLISEVFRILQAGFRTSPFAPAYGGAKESLMKKSALLAIGVGGLTAGTLDLTQAMLLFSTPVPLSIATGLLGPAGFKGRAGPPRPPA